MPDPRYVIIILYTLFVYYVIYTLFPESFSIYAGLLKG